MNVGRNTVCAVLAVGLVLIGAASSHAASVTVDFTGQVTSSEYGSISVGSPVTGSYSYDDAAAPYTVNMNPMANSAEYYLSSFTLAFADGSTMAATAPYVQIQDMGTPGFWASDSYSLYAWYPINLTGAFDGLAGQTMHAYWIDTTCTAFDDHVAFPGLPDPDMLSTWFSIAAGNIQTLNLATSEELHLTFDITYPSDPTPTVPIPGAIVLTALGTGLMAWRRRSKKA